MEAYGYREILESVLDETGGVHLISATQALRFLGVADFRTLYNHVPRFRERKKLPVEIFAKDLCAYAGGKEAGKGA